LARFEKTSDLFQLLQAANNRGHRRVRKAGFPIGNADLADINIASGIERDAVRGEEPSGLETGAVFAAQPRDAFSPGIHDAQARTEIWDLAIDRHAWTKLADNKIRLPAPAAVQRAWPVKMIPLRLVLAVTVEHLDPVVLAIGDVDPAIGVGDDIVHDVELAGIGAGFAPTLDEFAVRRKFVDAGIAVAVRDVDLAFG
jgi:hypothetical protein